MKKILLSTIICASALISSDISSKYEITPMYGYSHEMEDNKDENYNNLGVALSRNLSNNFFNQLEFSFLKSEKVDYKNSTMDTNINRLFVNGVKDFPLSEKLSAFGLVGLGHQNFSNEANGSEDSLLANYGAGLKYKIKENLSFKSDLRHILTKEDNSLLLTLGLAIGLGETKKAVKKVVEDPKPVMKKETLKDSDNDGLVDANDRCANTFPGAIVNINGCEIDTDNDTVVDRLDQCPSTKPGVKVNSNGCEIDSDKDGVVDSLDKCPNTPLYQKVNADGCAEKIELKVNFDYNSANIRNEDNAELDALAKYLNSQKDINIAIEAHTDSKGSEKYNLNLSNKRAISAKNALVDLGVDPSRIEAIGYGESQPIANNNTEEGRKENRRIEVDFK
jgi:OOP family OmpA-OmpF porin